MTEEQIKQYFGGNRVIYLYAGKLEDIKSYQQQQKNTSNFLKIGRNVYFASTQPCDKEGVTVFFDPTTGGL